MPDVNTLQSVDQAPWNSSLQSIDKAPWNQDLKASSASGPWYDYIFSKTPYSNIMSNIGEQAGGTESTVYQNTVEGLTKLGIFNDHKKNEQSLMKSFNEAFIKPLVLPMADIVGVVSGIGGGIAQSGKELSNVAKKTNTPVISNILGEAGEIMGAAGSGELAPMAGGFPTAGELFKMKSTSQRWLNAARAEGAIGETGDKFRGLKEPTMDDSWFRAKAVGELPKELPAANIHDLVRESYPSLFKQYDSLIEQDNEIRNQLQPINDAKAEIARINSDPEASTEDFAKQDKLSEFIKEKEADPQIKLAREDQQDILSKLIDYSPEVKSAYKEAQARIAFQRAQEPLDLTSDMEVPKEEEKPSAASGEAPKASSEASKSTAIYDSVYKQMKEAGRPEEEAQIAATMWQSRYNTRAARLGNTTADELFNKEAPKTIKDISKLGQRGSFSRTKNVIKLFQNVDSSTIFHESSHVWLEELLKDSSVEGASNQLKTDTVTITQWLKNKGGPVTVAQHEKFARGFERYLREGVAPNKALGDIFAQLKEWLTKLYQKVSDLKAPINDDVRKVFDRLLSTDEDIEDKEKPILSEQETPTNKTANIDLASPKALTDEQTAKVNAGTPNEELAQGERKFVDKQGNVRVSDITSDEDAQQAIRDVLAHNNEFLEVRKGQTSATDQLNFTQDMGADDPRAGMFMARKLAAKYNLPLDKTIFSVGTIMRQAAKDVAKYADAEDLENFTTAASNLIRLTETFSGMTAEWGRAGKAFQALYKEAEKAQELNQLLTDLTGKDLNQTKKIMQSVRVQRTPAAATRQVQRAYKPQFGDYITELTVNNYISGPITHMYYFLDTMIRDLGKTFITKPAEATVGSVKSVLGSTQERVTWGEVLDGMYGTTSGYISGFKAAATAVKLGIPQGLHIADLAEAKADWEIKNGFLVAANRNTRVTDLIRNPTEDMRLKAEAPQAAALSQVKSFKGSLGSIIRAPGERMVGPLHTINYVSDFQVNLGRLISREARAQGLQNGWSNFQIKQKMAELTANTPIDIVKQAREESLQNSLMSKPSEFIRRYQWLLKTPIGNMGPMLRWIEPFVSMTGKAISGGFKGTVGLPMQLMSHTFWKNVTGKNGAITQNRTLAEFGLGLGFNYLIWNMLENGTITDSAPYNRQEATVQEMTQGGASSLRIGDMTYQLEKFGVTGLRIALLADIHRMWDHLDKEELGPSLWSLAWDMGHHITQTGPISGISELLSAIEDPTASRAQNFINNLIVSTTLPYAVGLGQIAKKTDQYERMITADGKTGGLGEWHKLLELYKAQIPGLRETLQPRIDLFGNLVPSTKDSMLLYAQKVSDDPVYQALKTLKDPSHFAAPVKKDINGVPLTDEQYNDYAIKAGQFAYQRLRGILTNPQFDNLNATQQHDIIRSIFSDSRRMAEMSVMLSARGTDNDIAAKSVQIKQNLAQGLPGNTGVEYEQKVKGSTPTELGRTEGTEHLTTFQKAQFNQLNNLFSSDITKGNESPLSKLGAMIAKEKGSDVFLHWTGTYNMLGATFGQRFEEDSKNSAEVQLFKEMGVGPKDAANKIGIGPEAMSGTQKDVIYHELIHYALQQLRAEPGDFWTNALKGDSISGKWFTKEGLEKPNIQEDEDFIIPLIMYKHNIEPEYQKGLIEESNYNRNKDSIETLVKKYTPEINHIEKAATALLEKRYGKKK